VICQQQSRLLVGESTTDTSIAFVLRFRGPNPIVSMLLWWTMSQRSVDGVAQF
jgi:hypothetical protein